MAMTTLGDTAAGAVVNIEVDVIARYLERLLADGDSPAAGITRDTLARTGFLGDSPDNDGH